MQFAFDLISDLHIETWSSFDWTHRATSPYCVIAGDVAKDNEVLKQTLKHLSQCYQAVFYIDGNEEHKNFYEDLGLSFQRLSKMIRRLEDVIYLQGNVIIINGVAILATNGWWSYDFDPMIDPEKSQEWFEHSAKVDFYTSSRIKDLAINDAAYLLSTVKKMQMHNDVKKIVIVTHTVPHYDLIAHDIDLADTAKMNCTGNKNLMLSLNEDTEKKIHTWCFGHYHGKVDKIIQGVRFVNNCRGRSGTKWCQEVYHPLRIEIDI